MVFVFGSNLVGVHGAGAAKTALEAYGAMPGIGIGRQGNSYAIPTKDELIQTMALGTIRRHVDVFVDYARRHPGQFFKVTAIGCGLAGYTNKDIAPLFKDASSNCLFDNAWRPWLGKDFTYWGTYENT